MANVRKRISELTALNSASLDTTLVGVDGGTTYKIELDTLADAVTSRVNILDRDRLNSLESVTSSFETMGRSVISSSAQITTLGFISSSTTIPVGTISSSAQITSFGFVSSSIDITSLNSFTSSQSTLNTAFTNGINARLQTSSFNTFSQSVDSRLIAATNEQSLTHLVTTSSFNEYTASQSTSSLVDRLNAIENVSGSWITENETGSYLTSLNGAISSSSQLTSSYDTRYVLSGSITQTTWDNIASKPSDIVSGSSQLTASYDLRYTLSGSITQTTWDNIENKPAGIISSSGQIIGLGYATTSSLNSFTSSYNTDSSSFNSRFNGLVTTGSNTFSGSQVFSGSMTVTSGQIVASLITANTSSLYLTSGSNMYVQNNGVVEITGSLKVKGTSRFETVGGDEGGEIEFGVPQTNTTLSTSVKADVYQNRFRIFDGNTNGVYIDLSKAPTGANGELMHKASGFVNAGDYVTLGNLKARIPTSGNRSLQVATVSGTYSVVGSNVYSAAGTAGTSITSPLSITTTPAYLNAGLHFVAVGYTDTWIIMDYVAFIAWRITMVIGPSFNANLITIERLY